VVLCQFVALVNAGCLASDRAWLNRIPPGGWTRDPLRPNHGHTEKASKSKAGGLKRLPLLLFGLGIVLVVDLQELLLYNIEQQR